MGHPIAVVLEEQLIGHVAQLHLSRIVFQQGSQLLEFLAVSVAMATVTDHYLAECLVVTVQQFLCRLSRGIYPPDVYIHGGTAQIQFLANLTLRGAFDEFTN